MSMSACRTRVLGSLHTTIAKPVLDPPGPYQNLSCGTHASRANALGRTWKQSIPAIANYRRPKW
jgi:hypothetical protein